MKDRKEERCGKKFIVSFTRIEDQILSYVGVTTNISKNGMCIMSNTLIPENKNISVLIAAENEIIALNGNSQWNYTYPDSLIGTGVHITSPPEEYIKFISRINND